MKRLTILISPRATKEIDQAARWWAAQGFPTFIDDAIAEVLERLAACPEMAPRAQIRGKWSTTRRAPVDRGYHLYYRYSPRAETILVRCLWHERRRPPRL